MKLVPVDEDTAAVLRDQYERTGTPANVIVREALSAHLTELGPKLYFEYRGVFRFTSVEVDYGRWVTSLEEAESQRLAFGERIGIQWREIGPTHTLTEESHP